MYTMTSNPYQQDTVSTASPAQLVLMMYDRALTAIDRVRHVDPGDRANLELVNRELQRAQDILTELQFTLDRGRGGEIAESLDRLYAFCLEQLVKVNVSKDFGPLEEVRQVIRELRDAWEEACCKVVVRTG